MVELPPRFSLQLWYIRDTIFLPNMSPDIRKIIVDEVNQRGMTGYALWKLVKDKPGITKSGIYRLIKGKGSLSLKTAGYVMDALGLTIARRRARRHSD